MLKDTFAQEVQSILKMTIILPVELEVDVIPDITVLLDLPHRLLETQENTVLKATCLLCLEIVLLDTIVLEGQM